jgi:hypothetical protein
VFLIIYLSWTCFLALIALVFFGFMFYFTFMMLKAILLGDEERRESSMSDSSGGRDGMADTEAQSSLCTPLVVV